MERGIRRTEKTNTKVRLNRPGNSICFLFKNNDGDVLDLRFSFFTWVQYIEDVRWGDWTRRDVEVEN